MSMTLDLDSTNPRLLFDHRCSLKSLRIDEKRPNPVPGPGTYNIAGLSEKGKDFCAAPTIAAKLKVRDWVEQMLRLFRSVSSGAKRHED